LLRERPLAGRRLGRGAADVPARDRAGRQLHRSPGTRSGTGPGGGRSPR
jgi:hypothetical protein